MGSLTSKHDPPPPLVTAEPTPLQDAADDLASNQLHRVELANTVGDPKLGLQITSSAKLLRKAPKRWRGSKIHRVFQITVPDEAALADTATSGKEALKALLKEATKGEKRLAEHMHKLAEEEADEDELEAEYSDEHRETRSRARKKLKPTVKEAPLPLVPPPPTQALATVEA